MVILLILIFELHRHLVISFLINRYKQTVIVYRLFVIDIVRRGILFPDAYIRDIGNITNWVITR